MWAFVVGWRSNPIAVCELYENESVTEASKNESVTKIRLYCMARMEFMKISGSVRNMCVLHSMPKGVLVCVCVFFFKCFYALHANPLAQNRV